MDASMLNKQVVSYTYSPTTPNLMHIDLINPVKNVLAVKLIKVYAEIDQSSPTIGKQYLLDINEFNIASVYNNTNGHFTDCFATLTADINDKSSGNNLVINYDGFVNTMFREDPQAYSANPIIPTLNKIKFGLRDGDTGADININNIKRFHIQLCIYSQFAKLTMY